MWYIDIVTEVDAYRHIAFRFPRMEQILTRYGHVVMLPLSTPLMVYPSMNCSISIPVSLDRRTRNSAVYVAGNVPDRWHVRNLMLHVPVHIVSSHDNGDTIRHIDVDEYAETEQSTTISRTNARVTVR